MIKADVKIIKADLSKHKFIYLVPLSDLHWDEPQSDHDAIKGYVDWVRRQKNAFILLNGDLVTAPTAKSAASLYEAAEPGGTIEFPSLDQCSDELEELFEPVADKIIAACSGGHEFNHLFKLTGSDWTYNLMKRLGREKIYARDGGVLRLRIKQIDKHEVLEDTTFTIVFTHGWGGARTRGAKIRKLEYLASAFHADIYILSHDHTQNLGRDNYLEASGWDNLVITPHRKLLVSTGAFRGYSGYPFRGGYQPSDLGTPRIRIDKKMEKNGKVRKDIHASI